MNRSIVVNDCSILTDYYGDDNEDDENHLSGLSLPPKPGKILYPYFILLEIQPIEISQHNTKRRTYFLKLNMLPIHSTATSSLRYGVSTTATAAICDGFIADLVMGKILFPDSLYLAKNKNKLQRAR